jgi:hypothetical protein
MVRLYVPTPVLDIPERIHGNGAKFTVTYCDGRVVDYPGRINVVSWLFDSLVARLSSDSSIESVSVHLSSGRLLCRCGRFD